MVERGGLENRCARKRTEGSNPSLSATLKAPACPKGKPGAPSALPKGGQRSHAAGMTSRQLKALTEQSEV